jgi:hypothetical protein
MTTTALQKELIKKISKIKDKKMLASLNDFINQDQVFDKNGALILTPEMIRLIEISKEQYRRGEYKTHEQVMEEADLWLKERA